MFVKCLSNYADRRQERLTEPVVLDPAARNGRAGKAIVSGEVSRELVRHRGGADALSAARSPRHHVRVDALYHDGSRSLQDRFDTRRLADRIEERLVTDTIDESDRAFIERMDMFFLATADEQGRPTCSYKGGERGFVRVLDARTIAFPLYDGNGMYLSSGNVLRNPHVGILSVAWERQKRLRLEGEASIDPQDTLVSEFPRAQMVVRVRATRVYPNCPRYIHKLELVERSPSCPEPIARRPCRTGSAATGLPTCCRPATRLVASKTRLKDRSVSFG